MSEAVRRGAQLLVPLTQNDRSDTVCTDSAVLSWRLVKALRISNLQGIRQNSRWV